MHHLLLRGALRIQLGFGRGLLLLFAVDLHHMRAVGLVVVEHLAVEALNAFVRVDIALGVNRLHRAIVGAALAGVCAWLASARLHTVMVTKHRN